MKVHSVGFFSGLALLAMGGCLSEAHAQAEPSSRESSRFAQSAAVVRLTQAPSAKKVDSGTEYLRLKKQYESGRKDYSHLDKLVQMAEERKDLEFAEKAARDYIDNYLLQLPDEQLYTQGNLIFIGQHLVSTKDKAFRVFYPDTGKVSNIYLQAFKRMEAQNRAAGGGNILAPAIAYPGGYGASIVDPLIVNEEVKPQMEEARRKSSEVDWNRLLQELVAKFDSVTARRVIAMQKWRWFSADRPKRPDGKTGEAFLELIDVVGVEPAFNSIGLGPVNGISALFLLDVEDEVLLKKAAARTEEYMKITVKNQGDNQFFWFADLGNLGAMLYKAGDRERGISYVEQHARWPADCAIQEGHPERAESYLKSERYRQQLMYVQKMLKGEKVDVNWDVSIFN